MHRICKTLIATLSVIGLAIVWGDASAQSAGRSATISPHFVQGALLESPPLPSAWELAESQNCMEDNYQRRLQDFQLPIDPAAPPMRIDSPPSEAMSLDRTPGSFTVFRNTVMSDVFTNGQTSSVAEPSHGTWGRMVFLTGNWYASVSGDYGQTFTYINPYTTFPNPPSGGFCCDQLVYYERTRGIMCWYMQYGGNNNPGRLAISTSQANLAANIWHYYDITPTYFGYPASANFDFPDIAASGNNLYLTTNMGGATDAAIVMRINLDDLKAGNSIGVGNFASSLYNMRCTDGAGSTMYVGTQVDNNTLRIYSWPESSGSPTSVDRDVNTWYTATSSAPSPDGTDWVRRDFHDILASSVAGGRIVFMWDSSQGGGLSWPNVRYARFNTAGIGLVDQGTIWNGDYAWAYPDIHPNDRGHFAGVICLGGGTGVGFPYPSLAGWIADDYNAVTIAPIEAALFAGGTNGPANNRWGDYVTARRCSPYGNTWVCTGFVMNGGTASADVESRYVWFGRERDTPPASHTIYVDWTNGTNYEDGTATHPFNTVREGDFASVNGDNIYIRTGTYNETLSFAKDVDVHAENGVATIGN